MSQIVADTLAPIHAPEAPFFTKTPTTIQNELPAKDPISEVDANSIIIVDGNQIDKVDADPIVIVDGNQIDKVDANPIVNPIIEIGDPVIQFKVDPVVNVTKKASVQKRKHNGSAPSPSNLKKRTRFFDSPKGFSIIIFSVINFILLEI
jgi:hypothetical protein